MKKIPFPKTCDLFSRYALEIIDNATLAAKFDAFLQKEGIKVYAVNKVIEPIIAVIDICVVVRKQTTRYGHGTNVLFNGISVSTLALNNFKEDALHNKLVMTKTRYNSCVAALF